jgi:dihydroorotate dehydrogenase
MISLNCLKNKKGQQTAITFKYIVGFVCFCRSSFMYSLLRPWLFKLDAEQAHGVVLSTLNWVPKRCFATPAINKVEVMGMEFLHPVGLAAGLDKNGEYLDALAKIGFSFIEIGTVTPRPQLGNPKPRLFRVLDQQAVVNRMGFNNHGVDALVNNIKKSPFQGILGVNIGKNKDTPLDSAVDDYLFCMRAVYPYASYITVNISSPNTPDLRQLQKSHYFSKLLSQLHTEQLRLTDRDGRQVPLVVKISPDEDDETLKAMVHIMLEHDIKGIIATNTTSQPEYFRQLPPRMKQGGLSGKPLQSLSTSCLRLLKRYVGDDMALIGVGGVHDTASAQEKMDAGASLVQVYSGLIYQGPELVLQLAAGLMVGKKEHVCD